MIRVLFLLRSLEIGGAERQVTELVRNIDHAKFNIEIVTFYGGGPLEKELDGIDKVKVLSLGKAGRWDLFSFLAKLIAAEKAFSPHIIVSYLDVPNSFNVLTGKLLGTKVILGASASYVDFSRYDWTAALVYQTGAILSRFADMVIANSYAGEKYNIQHGYSAKNMTVIPNGIDTQIYHPDKISGKRLRLEWGISDNELVIGHVGRIDPMKDHPNLFNASAIINQSLHNVRIVCVGDGPEPHREEMKTLADSLGLSNLVWARVRSDMPAVFNAFDILVSSSYGEGLSVVLGEAMASGIPCVVTNVGDSAYAVGEAGLAVQPKNPGALADAIRQILELPDQKRLALGQKARQRVLDYFSIEKMTSAYQEAFETVTQK